MIIETNKVDGTFFALILNVQLNTTRICKIKHSLIDDSIRQTFRKGSDQRRLHQTRCNRHPTLQNTKPRTHRPVIPMLTNITRYGNYYNALRNIILWPWPGWVLWSVSIASKNTAPARTHLLDIEVNWLLWFLLSLTNNIRLI